MVRLDLHREPFWVDIGSGARVLLRPQSAALIAAARAMARNQVSLRHIDATEVKVTARDAAIQDARYWVDFISALARLAIIDWTGVGDRTGTPATVSEAGIAALIELVQVSTAFVDAYLAPVALLDAERTRLLHRAEWQWSGGRGYCANCAASGEPCADDRPGPEGALCPYRQYEPVTLEGWQAWDLVERLGGQIRIGPNGRILGYDLTAALGLAAALGYDSRAMAELLPALEAGMVRGCWKQQHDNAPDCE